MKRIPALLFGLVLGLLCVEGAMRALFAFRILNARRLATNDFSVADEPEKPWREYDPLLGWKNRPGAFVRDYALPGADVHINSQGLRGERDYSPAKRPGHFRILLIGDSVAFGFGLADQDTLGPLLEKMLPGAEVLNASVTGYGLDQDLLAYERDGRAFGADLVMLVGVPAGLFGRSRVYVSGNGGYEKPRFVVVNGVLRLTNVPVPRSRREASGLSGALPLLASPEPFLPAFIDRIRGKRGPCAPYLGVALEDALLARLRRDVAADGALLAIVACPAREQLGLKPEGDRWRARLEAFALADGDGFLDLTPVFARGPSSDAAAVSYYFEQDGGRILPGAVHWSARGSRAAARAIAGYLRKTVPGAFRAAGNTL